jgi:putative ABC transport system permease protein
MLEALFQGLYGIVSYEAAGRRFEIGVRMALGAPSSAIVGLMLRDAVVIVCVGSMAGSGLSFALTRAIWPLLAGDQGSMAPLAIVAVFVTTLMVAVVAALRPALAAAALNPVLALRHD